MDASILGKGITGKGVVRARKVVLRASKGYNSMDQMDQGF